MLAVSLKLRIHDRLEGPLGALKRFQEFLVLMILQRFLIPVFLTLVYFLVFGPASLLARVFARSLFQAKCISEDTYWIEARGYEADPEKALRQS